MTLLVGDAMLPKDDLNYLKNYNDLNKGLDFFSDPKQEKDNMTDEHIPRTPLQEKNNMSDEHIPRTLLQEKENLYDNNFITIRDTRKKLLLLLLFITFIFKSPIVYLIDKIIINKKKEYVFNFLTLILAGIVIFFILFFVSKYSNNYLSFFSFYLFINLTVYTILFLFNITEFNKPPSINNLKNNVIYLITHMIPAEILFYNFINR